MINTIQKKLNKQVFLSGIHLNKSQWIIANFIITGLGYEKIKKDYVLSHL